jgi:oligoribonuclease NrnB/cAMP/cGMP phosphodiesterase (DHH superfamily)
MREQKKYLIIYHREDNDGVFSAAIFYEYLINELHYKLEDLCFIGADYNELTKFAKENTVKQLHEDFENIIMTDISFNDVSYMKALWKEFSHNFIWCDHHAPIINESIKNRFDDIPGIRDTSRSAILCVWKYLYDQFDEAYNAKKVPELLRILSAWDSWSYEREGYDFEFVRDVNKGVTIIYNLELGKIKNIIELLKIWFKDESNTIKDVNFIKEMEDYGHIINDYEDRIMENIIKNSGDCSWKVKFDDEDRGRPLYHSACAIFHQGATNSTMFKCLQRKGINHGLVFKHHPNGNWILSMYNINDSEWTHCGDFLKERYNGGGHRGAAGCTLTQEQFINILKTKQL